MRWCCLLLVVLSPACTRITPLNGDSTGGGAGTTTTEDGSTSILDPTMPQSTSSGDASSSGSSGDDGGNFLDVDPDTDADPGMCGALVRSIYECSLWAQDCCHLEACKPWANDGGGYWNATRCTPVADRPGQLGDPCTMEGSPTSGIDTCDIGLMCFGVDTDTLEGTCIELCNGEPDDPICTDPAQTCVITNEGYLPICQTECDPLQQDCAEGQGCYGVPSNRFTCQSPDAGFIGCPVGQTPVQPELEPSCEGGWPCCVPFCDLMEPASCEAPTECTPLFEGVEDVGYCRSPD